MSETYLLRREQLVPASLEETFRFFADAANLQDITPPWLHFRILSAPEHIETGSEIRYRLRWHGIPLNWRTRITRWDMPLTFEDFQESGPYRLWHHTHTFQASPEGTLMTDIVRYALPLGPLGRLAHWIAVRKSVEEIFEYRYRRIAEIFAR